jgi:N-acetylglucosaminyldiphosphoundecaprenol N-acetyl-beta-D-mannosaminyltransferase
MPTSRLLLGPVVVDRVTTAGALSRIEALLRTRRGGFVVTPNVDHIVLADRSPTLRRAYARAALSLADGQPVLWMARLLGSPLPEKISGSDFILPLMSRAAVRGWGVFLYGATPAVSAKAASRLERRFPNLRIVGRDTSRWDGQPDPALAQRIRASGADLVVVALGCPKQEAWMLAHADLLGGAVAIGLGGTLDFVAGAVPRAPRWMSRAGLEWAYRLAREPRRLAHRYLVRDAAIVPIFARLLLQRLTARRVGAPVVSN